MFRSIFRPFSGGRPKHVGANFKCFNVKLVLFKVYIVCVCMSWNIKEIIETTCTVQQ